MSDFGQGAGPLILSAGTAIAGTRGRDDPQWRRRLPGRAGVSGIWHPRPRRRGTAGLTSRRPPGVTVVLGARAAPLALAHGLDVLAPPVVAAAMPSSAVSASSWIRRAARSPADAPAARARARDPGSGCRASCATDATRGPSREPAVVSASVSHSEPRRRIPPRSAMRSRSRAGRRARGARSSDRDLRQRDLRAVS